MNKSKALWLIAAAGAMIFAAGCVEKNPPMSGALEKQIAFGEKVFVQKECGKCHVGAGLPVQAALQQPQMKAPELTSVFLAIDTVFIKAHLRFIELSQMPPIDLTQQEIDALAKYVASLHAKAKTDPNLRDPDGACPVCGASLKMAGALQTSYQGQSYYFECEDCQRLFERDAGWYANK
ncbi:MAG: YHS domain-containing protein [candidate division KSB1 bacterium]|nr:YHS domain-containing protein [candidate division KSB1 bacterium]MDZ7368328.1 YHS domain-containing protein [candidate division KSB1 bacterium]MDZ7403048.1 YHS domain-containing protein [candidate division KSB1 bacterium]